MAIRMVTEEMIVLNKDSKDVTCKDGQTRTYYNIKCGTASYENQLIGVTQEIYDNLSEGDKVIFKGNFGGLQNKFWRVTDIEKLTPKK